MTDVFNKFKDGDNFFCLMGETDKSPTAMYNLYRCSQVSFPGEKILEDANKFTHNFLLHCLSNNQSLDKWSIAKDIPGEVHSNYLSSDLIVIYWLGYSLHSLS